MTLLTFNSINNKPMVQPLVMSTSSLRNLRFTLLAAGVSLVDLSYINFSNWAMAAMETGHPSLVPTHVTHKLARVLDRLISDKDLVTWTVPVEKKQIISSNVFMTVPKHITDPVEIQRILNMTVNSNLERTTFFDDPDKKALASEVVVTEAEEAAYIFYKEKYVDFFRDTEGSEVLVQ